MRLLLSILLAGTPNGVPRFDALVSVDVPFGRVPLVFWSKGRVCLPAADEVAGFMCHDPTHRAPPRHDPKVKPPPDAVDLEANPVTITWKGSRFLVDVENGTLAPSNQTPGEAWFSSVNEQSCPQSRGPAQGLFVTVGRTNEVVVVRQDERRACRAMDCPDQSTSRWTVLVATSRCELEVSDAGPP